MKKRIKIDSSILSIIILFTGLLYLFPQFYPDSRGWDDVLDFAGLLAVLEGAVWRMWGRGHKKANSQKGGALVISGPYLFTRNPMYLGSFLMGAGFVLIVWPWWSLPIFAGLFYARFNRQMAREEEHLTKLFGEDYVQYCKKVPRTFPSLSSFNNIKALKKKKVLSFEEMFTTKETRGLWTWPLLAVALESFQESVIFGTTDLAHTLSVFVGAMMLYALGFWAVYKIFGDDRHKETG